MMLAKDKAGLPEMVIPGADSSEKQMGEIQILLQSAPEPNPALQQAQQKIQQAAIEAQQKGIPIPPEAAQQAQQQLAQIPQVISTVKLGKLDDHAGEMNEIETWARSSDGIRAAAEQPEGYENVMTHYDEHAAALKAQQAGNQPQGKPPSDSLTVNFKDLPIDGKVQAAGKVGIQLDAGKMQAEEQQEDAKELAVKAAQKPPMIQ
jgi:hypothetical protein